MGITLKAMLFPGRICSRSGTTHMDIEREMWMHYKYPPLQEATGTVGGTNSEHLHSLAKRKSTN